MGFAPEELIHAAGGLAALADGPDHQQLAIPTEQVWSEPTSQPGQASPAAHPEPYSVLDWAWSRGMDRTEVRFLDLDQVLRDLRSAAADARRAHPEIVQVYLFGSLVRGNWTADSDADLIVVARKEFPDFVLSRSAYQIFTSAIPTDTLVYSESEFEKLRADPSSLVAQGFPSMVELLT